MNSTYSQRELQGLITSQIRLIISHTTSIFPEGYFFHPSGSELILPSLIHTSRYSTLAEQLIHLSITSSCQFLLERGAISIPEQQQLRFWT